MLLRTEDMTHRVRSVVQSGLTGSWIRGSRNGCAFKCLTTVVNHSVYKCQLQMRVVSCISVSECKRVLLDILVRLTHPRIGAPRRSWLHSACTYPSHDIEHQLLVGAKEPTAFPTNVMAIMICRWCCMACQRQHTISKQ